VPEYTIMLNPLPVSCDFATASVALLGVEFVITLQAMWLAILGNI
jgi:hypothetical protein